MPDPSGFLTFLVLQINVFVLGSTYMKLVKELNLNHRDIPVIDPAVYISRFAALLDFGDEENRVANDAVRLVQRFSRDWMDQGRRPAGICGACLIIAARMNNFRRSLEEVTQVVKIAETTVRKRLEEFATTETSTLTIQDWRSGAWFDEAADPPAFVESTKRDQRERIKAAQAAQLAKRASQRVRFAGDCSDEEQRDLSDVAEEDENEDAVNRHSEGSTGIEERPPVASGSARTELNADLDALEEGDSAALAANEEEPAADGDRVDDDAEDDDAELDDILGGINSEVQALTGVAKKKRGRPPGPPTQAQQLGWKGRVEPPPDTRTAEEIAQDEQEHDAIASDITASLSAKPYVVLDSELTDKERARYIAAQAPPKLQQEDDDGRLSELDDEDLDAYILTEEEVRIKERLWMEFNKEYLEKVAERHLRAEIDEKPLRKRDRKKKPKPRDSSTALGETAAESTKKLLKQKKFSKKINYAAIESLLGDDHAMEGIDGLSGAPKRDNLFDEDANDAWEGGSQRSSRAPSLVPSMGSSSGGKKKRKRRSSSASVRDDAGEQAERLRKKLQNGSKKPVKRTIGPVSGKKVNPDKIKATFGAIKGAAPAAAEASEPAEGIARSPIPQSPGALASPEPADSPGEEGSDDDEEDEPPPPRGPTPPLDPDQEYFKTLMKGTRAGSDDEDEAEAEEW